MKRTIGISLTLATTFAAGTALAAEPAPSPKAMIAFEAELVGSSTSADSNFKPAVKTWIDSYYNPGPCISATNYANCDDIRFGLSVHAGPGCDVSMGNEAQPDDDPLAVFYSPAEDVADDIQSELTGNFNSAEICAPPNMSNLKKWDHENHDTAAQAIWESHFPATTSANDAQLDKYWAQPNLNLWGMRDIAQSADGDDDDRVVKTLQTICDMYQGLPATAGRLPSIPTWVITERNSGDPEVLFGGLMSAAGGTGVCQIRQMGSWVDLDVCAHADATTDGAIRSNIQTGKYRCAGGSEDFSTGNMNYEGASGNQANNVIQCHLVGESFNNNCSSTGGIETDLFGKFRCIRQLSREQADNADQEAVWYCPDECEFDSDCGSDAEDRCVRSDLFGHYVCVEDECNNSSDCAANEICYIRTGAVPPTGVCGTDSTAADISTKNCVNLNDSGDIEFIDADETLFHITRGPKEEGESCSDNSECQGVCLDGECVGDRCEPGRATIISCTPDEPCDTGLEGRCGPGVIDCSTGVPVCKAKFGAFPEVCNGLDDDCDGVVDNMKESWNKSAFSSYSLPNDHQGLHCNLVDVCVCPNGATDTHNGTDWDAFLDSWSGVCQCGEGLEPGSYTPPTSEGDAQTDAACSAVADNSIPVSFLGLMVLGIVGLVRRRKQ